MRPELARLLSDLRPAELALRDWVRPRLDADLVREMAELDYGMKVDEHRQAIEELLVVQRLPAELEWTPREVLELASYGVPDDPRGLTAPTGTAGHLTRLFACLVLVRADDAQTPAATLAGLVESALVLGPEATDHAIRYLAWCRLHESSAWRDDPRARPFLTLGLLLLCLGASGPADPVVVRGLAGAFVAEVEDALTEDSWVDTPGAMLKKAAGGERWRTWRAVASRYLIDSAAGPDLDTVRLWLGVA